MSSYTEVPLQQQLLRHPPVHLQEWPLQQPSIPLPPAYSRNISYDYSSSPQYNHNSHIEKNSTQAAVSDIDSFEGNHDTEYQKSLEDGRRLGKRQISLLMILRGSRIYIRVAAALCMIASLSLVLAAVISFAKAKNDPKHPLKPTIPVTDYPCIVFSGIAAMNLVLSISLLLLSCISSKFRKSNDAINAVFCIVSAVGFASSMGACFFLNKQTTLQNDLWKWACNNHKQGTVSDVLDFNMVCHVVDYGWKFGLVQASLELLTFIIGIVAFVVLKFSNFTRFGLF